jgi:hypothetical protein
VDFNALVACTDLRDAHIAVAVRSSETMASLLARFAEIAGPKKGAPIILAALARLGTTDCDWIDGDLRIELEGDARHVKISVSSTLGAGFREKLFADTTLHVPFDEFVRGIARAPKIIEPLEVVHESGSRIVLSVAQEVRRTSLPPAMVTLDPETLMAIPRAPAHVRADTGAADAVPPVVLRGRKPR